MATSSLHLHLDSLDRTYLWPIKQLRTSFERTSRRAALSLKCHGKEGWDQVDEEWCLVTNDILTASAFADKLAVPMDCYAVYLNVCARDLRNIIIPARIIIFSKVTFLWNSWEKFADRIFPKWSTWKFLILPVFWLNRNSKIFDFGLLSPPLGVQKSYECHVR